MNFTLKTFLPYRLNRLAEAVSAEIRPVYRDRFGLNRPEWRALVALADIGPCTAKEIGAHSAQHKTKVSRAVWALEQRRWLRRETAPADRRSETLSLTPAGRCAYGELLAPMCEREEQILGRLNVKERAALDIALSALEAAMGLGRDRRRA